MIITVTVVSDQVSLAKEIPNVMDDVAGVAQLVEQRKMYSLLNREMLCVY